MKSPSDPTAVVDSLDLLSRRIRWKRWLGKLNRFAWLLAAFLVILFCVDLAFGMRTLALRIASAGTLVLAAVLLVADWFLAWQVRLDRVGLAQLLEKRYPELAERLVTLVQLEADGASTGLTPLLAADTNRRLARVEPAEACSLKREYLTAAVTGVMLLVVFAGLAVVPAFGSFTYRFLFAYSTPLVPFTFDVMPGSGYALRGEKLSIDAAIHMLDQRAVVPTECELICVGEDGAAKRIAMKASSGRYVSVLENVRDPLRFRVEANGYASETFSIQLIDAPAFTARPTVEVVPPSYLSSKPVVNVLDETNPGRIDILLYSAMRFHLPLDRAPKSAFLSVVELGESDNSAKAMFTIPVQWRNGTADGYAEVFAKQCGKYEAYLALELEHGLTTRMPIGRWEIHDDSRPRFTQPLRLDGAAGTLHSSQEYRVAPDDFLKLQTAVEDDEGLGAIALEYRINDGPAQMKPWLNGNNRKELAIHDWLPLPAALKEKDRVQFRIHVSDNRRLDKGAIVTTANEVLPGEDLLPQVVTAPSDADGWINLRVESGIGGFVKEQTKVQSDEIIDLIGKIKKKVQSETADVQELQRTIHRQTALMPAQAKQAEKLQKLNQEIMEDLNEAGKRLLTNPALASLAGHFFDIAETEMRNSDEALERFREKDRPLPEAEKELKIAEEALGQAKKKLERLLDWNKTIAEDRFDQWQIEKLEQRQRELAQRLEKLQEQRPLSDAELAKEIAAIKQEQAKLAAETGQLQEKSRLVKDSLAALEQMRVEQVAQAAAKLAAEQEAMRELDPDKLPADLKETLAKLVQRQADLAQRAATYAEKNQGPDVKPAAEAAVALKKPKLEDAIERQKEHEKREREWLGKLLPGRPINELREQVAKLALQQQAIRADLEKLGRDLPQLNEKMLEDRLRDLVTKQKDLAAGTAKLPIADADKNLRDLQQSAANTAKQASDQLAAKDPLAAFDTMEKAQLQLRGLAGAMPESLPIDRKEIKDAAVRAKIEQVEKFEQEQKQLREETEKLLADWLKSSGAGGNPLKEKLAKLAGDLLELSQKGASPEAKAMAKESMQAVDDAKKAMDASQAMKAKGDGNEAKKMDEEAAKKLELAVKQLEKLVQDQAAKGMPKDGAEKTAEALEDSKEKMRQAEANLPKMPKDAQEAMQAAAKRLADASNQMSKQAAKNLPSPPARNPAARSPAKAGISPTSIGKLGQLDPSIGAAWGDLPGELKTRMLQDFRARYGEDYAEMIREYFERLAEARPDRK